MTKKRERARFGRELRKATGLALPVAMSAAKAAMSVGLSKLLAHPNVVAGELYVRGCGLECCGYTCDYFLEGPKGRVLILQG